MDEKILELIKAGKTDEEIVEIMAFPKKEKRYPNDNPKDLKKLEELRKNYEAKDITTYIVTMTETHFEAFKIEASNEDEAVKICEEKWFNGELGEPIKYEITDRFFQSEGLK